MNKHLSLGVFSLMLGLTYLILALRISLDRFGDPMGPKYFPIGIGIMMILLSILVIFIGIKDNFKRTKETENKNTLNKGFLFLTLSNIIIGIIYGMVFYKIGFVFSTILFLGSLLVFVNGRRHWKLNIVLTISFVIGVKLILEKVFLISLP